MAFVTKIEAFIISEIKSTIMDRLHMGGSFLQQIPTVTVNGLPVAIKQGGALGALGGALGAISQAVQVAGSIASLVQNPMALVESAVGSAISAVSGQISAVAGQLTGGQLSQLTGAISGITNTLNDFQAHTANLSGLASSISDTIPDFNRLKDLGNSITSLGSDTRDGFISNTASALFSDTKLNDVKDALNVTVLSKLELIKREDAGTAQGQAAIASYVSQITTLLNTSNTAIDTIVVTDTHNFNESSNNLTASTTVVSLAEQFANTDSVSYTLLNRVGKTSTISAFNTAIEDATGEA